MSGALRVIGVGSPAGDDQCGWIAVERLRASSLVRASAPERVSLDIRDRPGVLLVEAWRGAQKVILVDAVRAGSRPGTVYRLEAQDIPADLAFVTSHGFGVAETLALARAIGELPPALTLFGVEIASPACGTTLSPAVRAALPGLVSRLEGEIRAFLAD